MQQAHGSRNAQGVDIELDQAHTQGRGEVHTRQLLHHHGRIHHGQALRNNDGEQVEIMGQGEIKVRKEPSMIFQTPQHHIPPSNLEGHYGRK